MTNPARRLIELDTAKRLRIAVVGDAMTDVYIHGQLGECQEDCYKFVEESRIEVPGGAANALRSLDGWQATLVELFPYTDLPIKTRFVVNGKYMFRHDSDRQDDPDIFTGDREACMFALIEHPVDGILISDYDKGFLTPEFIRQIIDLANERHIPVVADAKREPSLYEGATIKCNFAYACKFQVSGHCQRAHVITNGAKCPHVVLKSNWDQREWIVAKEMTPVVCRNHVGAGDCFSAHLTLALAHGFTLEDAAAVAHSAGRVYVQHEHNRPPLPEEIAADMEAA